MIQSVNNKKIKEYAKLIQKKERDKTNLFLGSLTLAHSQYSQMSFMYGFFFVKFLFLNVVCVVIVI